ncbi:hypothetical protein PENTCL1PPCAC_8933, partial [Pristionchus entomophagus]
IFGFLGYTTIHASFLFGIFLALNRFLAIARVSLFRKWNQNYVRVAVALTYPVPLLFGARLLIWRPYLFCFDGKAGPIFLFYTPPMGDFTEIFESAMVVYYLLCCTVEIVFNGATLSAIVGKKFFERSAAKRRAEIGLYVTTLSSFALSILYASAQVCIQFFPLSTAALFALSGSSILFDLITLSSVYFLLSFSPAIRRYVFSLKSSYKVTSTRKQPTSSLK